MAKYEIPDSMIPTIKTLIVQGAQNLVTDTLKVFDNPIDEKKEEKKKE